MKSFGADFTDGLIDLERVAARLELRVYSVALSKIEYLRRLSIRMLHLEVESPFLLVPQPPQLDLPSHELNHRLEVNRNDFKGMQQFPVTGMDHPQLQHFRNRIVLVAALNSSEINESREKEKIVYFARAKCDGLLDSDSPGRHMKLCVYDRLSDLPDEMLHHVMSFLSAQEVSRTCVLSRRWRLLWASAPCLDISIDKFANDRVRFSKFVDQFLLLRSPASLDAFRLHSFAIDRACNWIEYAIKHNVRVLEFTECIRWEPFYLEPQLIALASRFLKCLKLTNVTLDAEVFDPLNHACPALENLQLIRSFLEVPVISSNSLKKLDIIHFSLLGDLVICAPNLISLHFESPQCKSSSLEGSSITRAMVTLCDLSNANNIELTFFVRKGLGFGIWAAMSRKFMENFLKRKPSDDANNVGASRQRQQPIPNNVRNAAEEDINWEEEIQFDPGKRKETDDYHPNHKDKVRRKYLENGPCQPRTLNFPITSMWGKNRRFNPEWFDEFGNWLEYSESKDRAYCFPCFLMRDRSKKEDGYKAFVVDGWNGWHRKARLDDHVGDVGSPHNIAVKKCDDLLNQEQHIDVAYQQKSEAAKNAYLVRLNGSVDVVRVLLKQGLAFRGHDESKKSYNKGNLENLEIVLHLMIQL
ncbi:hypothetical protein ACP70R_046018 [Stipagrostis hirtigluma subsp. patula]